MKCSVVIVAAGDGTRIGGRKLLMDLGGRPLVAWTLEPFLQFPDTDEIVLVVHHGDRARCEEFIGETGVDIRIVTGGRERQDSVYEGIKSLERDNEVIIVHDGARPFVSLDTIRSVVEKVEKDGVGAIAALPVRDTIKRVINGRVQETLPRKMIWSVQTPQAFPSEMLLRAYDHAMKDGFYSTDDAALCERLGYSVELVMGETENIKITVADDLLLAEMIIRSRGSVSQG